MDTPSPQVPIPASLDETAKGREQPPVAGNTVAVIAGGTLADDLADGATTLLDETEQQVDAEPA